MKLEIISCSEAGAIETYWVQGLSLQAIQEWQELPKTIPLCEFSEEVAKLKLNDTVTNAPLSTTMNIDIYMTDPMKDEMFSLFAKSLTSGEASSSDLEEEVRNEVVEQAYEQDIELATILSAVVREITQNHLPLSAYRVRICDG